MKSPDSLSVISFDTAKKWESWLAKNHAKSQGIWLRFYKKASGVKTVVYAEALDVALCYGWIDGLVKTYDAKSYIQRFTPRRKKSLWSQRNVEHIARLTKLKRMKPAGLLAVKLAKVDGRWERAYHPPSRIVLPKDFLDELKKNKKAEKFFETLNKSNKYYIYFQLHNAKKPETRTRRMKLILQMMKKAQKLW